MPLHDSKRHIYPLASLLAAAVTAAANGAGVDTRDYDSALALLNTGVLAGSATPAVTFKLQESDDDATYTDVADADLSGGTNGIVISAANGNNAGAAFTRTYMGNKRYIRWVCSAVSGTTPSVPACGQVLGGRPHAYLGY